MQSRGCAKAHLHRELDPLLPVQWRADTIAVTNQACRAPLIRSRGDPPEAISSARR